MYLDLLSARSPCGGSRVGTSQWLGARVFAPSANKAREKGADRTCSGYEDQDYTEAEEQPKGDKCWVAGIWGGCGGKALGERLDWVRGRDGHREYKLPDEHGKGRSRTANCLIGERSRRAGRMGA